MQSYNNMKNKYLRQDVKDCYKPSDYIKYLLVTMAFSCAIIVGLYYQQAMYFSALLWALFLFFIPTEYSIMALLYLMSFEYVFRFTTTSGSIFTFLQIIPVIKIVFFDKVFSIDKKCLFSYMLLLVYICTVSFTEIQSFLRIAFGLIILVCVFQNETGKRINCKHLIVFYSVGIIMSALFAATNSRAAAPYISNLVVRLSDGSALYRFTGLYSNPNYFSIEVSLALAGNLVLFMSKEEKWYELVLIGGLLFWLGIVSQSKTFTISLAFMLVYTIIYYGRHKPTYLLGLMLLILSAAFFFKTEVRSFFEKYLYRFISLNENNSSIDDITTGRIEIWKMYIDAFISDFRVLFLGNGIGSKVLNYDAHNMYIESIYCLGIIGSAIYGVAIWGTQNNTIKRRNYLLFLSVLLIRGLAANIAFYINVYYYFLILFVMMGSNASNIEIHESTTDQEPLLRNNPNRLSYIK